MSRRCRHSLSQMAARGAGSLSSGCDCARLGGISDAAPPCTHLLSPSFLSLDQHVASYGLGDTDEELPFGSDREFEGGDKASGPAYVLTNATPKYSDDPANIIRVSDIDPPAGHTYHLYNPGAGGSGFSNIIVSLTTGPHCRNGFPSFFSYTSAATPGDLVVVQFQHKVSSIVSPATVTRVFVDELTLSNRFLPAANQLHAQCPTSYETVTFAVFITRPDLVATNVRLELASNFTPQWFLGAISFSLISGVGKIILCSSFTLIEVDNSTIETSFV